MQAVRRHTGKYYFLTGMLVSVILAGIGFIVIGVWPFGDGTVLIIDSLHQYLPFYTDYHEKLTSGQSLLYSFSAGLGYNFWATWAYYLASPLNFLIALVPTQNVCDFMDLMILIKIGLCGGCMTWYLHRRNTRSFALSVAFGTMFALSNFMIGYYFNLMWLDSVAMLPLCMCGIEQICGIGENRTVTDRSDGRLYGLALCIGVWCNYYIGFMLCIFSVLYFAVCLIIAGKCRVRRFFTRILRFGWFSLLGGGCGAVVLLPAYRALTASEAMQNNRLPITLESFDSFLDMLLTHFAGIKPINIANTQVGLNAYCGVIVLILVLLFAMDRYCSIRERIARIALALFLLLSFTMKTLNYIWHGFHQQNGLPNRFAFVYIAILLTMAFDVLRDLKKMRLWCILACGAAPIVFALVCLIGQFGEDYENHPYPSRVFLITIALLAGYLVLLLVLRFVRMPRRAAALLLAALCITEAGVSAVYGIICNDSVTRSIYLKDQDSYKTLMAQIGDEDWFRSEVDAQRMRNVTLFCGGNSVVMFNSTMQESVTDFCDRIGMEARTNKNGYNGVTDLMNDVLGIRYVLSANGRGSTLYGMETLTKDNNLTVYENPDALPIGFLANPGVTEWTLSGATPIDVQNDFVSLAAGHDPIYTLDRYVTLENDVSTGIKIPEGKQVYVYLPNRVKELVVTTPEFNKTYTTFTDHLYVIEGCDGSDEASLKARINGGGTQEAIIYTCPDKLEQEVVDILSESVLENVEARGSKLSGTIDAARDGELVITVPYDRSWTCMVDGKKVEADCIGEALTGLPLTRGRHEIKMTYMPGGMETGLWISLLCAGAMVLSFLYEWKKRKKERAMEQGTVVTDDAVCRITDIVGEKAVFEHESMKKHTTFRIGGEADLYVVPESIPDLARVLDWCRQQSIPYYVIGNGSNLLVSDEGYRGVIIQISKNLSRIRVAGNEIEAEAGALLSTVAKRAMEASLTGLEPVSGIPGTLGGALVMNAGAYGAEMKDFVKSVRVLDGSGMILELPGEEMEFGYRTSIAMQRNLVILSATLVLEAGEKEQIAAAMEDIRQKRQLKQPLTVPSAGSTFKRPEGCFAGALIDEAGLRGYRVGGAQVSEKHCGFVVNTGKATAEDVRELIREVQQIVFEHAGVRLEPEVRMLGFAPDEAQETQEIR